MLMPLLLCARLFFFVPISAGSSFVFFFDPISGDTIGDFALPDTKVRHHTEKSRG